MFQGEEDEDFLSISRAMEEIIDDSVDCYWLIKSFVSQFHTRFGDSLPHLVSFYWKMRVSWSIKDPKRRNSLELVSVVVAAAKESGTLPESGGTSPAEPPEGHWSTASATLQSLVQTLFRWLPPRIQPAEVRPLAPLTLYVWLFNCWETNLRFTLTCDWQKLWEPSCFEPSEQLFKMCVNLNDAPPTPTQSICAAQPYTVHQVPSHSSE